jgi:hypothetical protein
MVKDSDGRFYPEEPGQSRFDVPLDPLDIAMMAKGIFSLGRYGVGKLANLFTRGGSGAARTAVTRAPKMPGPGTSPPSPARFNGQFMIPGSTERYFPYTGRFSQQATLPPM